MKELPGAWIRRLHYPAVPVVVAAAYRGRVSAMPVASMMSLSDKPPLVGISCGSTHSTTATIMRSRRFSVTWLDLTLVAALERMATVRGTEVADKLTASGLEHHAGAFGCPVIDKAAAYLECSVIERRTTGDHELFVGKVRKAMVSDDFHEYWAFKRYHPILYTGLTDRLKTYRQT